MRIVIARQELAAALLFASTDESRYLITGVSIEVRPGKRPLIVATDGRRLVSIETVAEQYDHFSQEVQLTVAPDWADLFVKLGKAVGSKLFPWLCIEHDPGSQQVTVHVVGREETSLEVKRGVLMEGDFPNWRKALPKRNQIREGITDLGVNAEFVGDFAKAAKLLEVKDNVIQMNLVGKEQQVEVKIMRAPNFYGLIMQCKLEEVDNYQPDFLSIMKDVESSAAPAKLAELPVEEELVAKAAEAVRGEGRASVTFLQRHFRLGYVRAQELITELEKREVVGPAKANGEPREVYGV
jgi:hypothetical protein